MGYLINMTIPIVALGNQDRPATKKLTLHFLALTKKIRQLLDLKPYWALPSKYDDTYNDSNSVLGTLEQASSKKTDGTLFLALTKQRISVDNLELGEVDSLKNGTFSELVLKSKIEEEMN